ncbi:hypothetical protein [Amycolatopsis sp. NPDC059021]|uniref:hypothetical protein n=1 Tax=Amycolatopsis sp. NPDC059021 TaxID=3346704 RepID=UPI003671C609
MLVPGSATGGRIVHCGSSRWTLTGLIQTNIGSEPGDDGRPLFDGTTALGLTIGATGDCASGGDSYFEPVTTVLAATGATLP